MTQSTVTQAADDKTMARRIATMMRLGTAVASVLLVVGAILAYTDARLAGTVLLAGGCGLLVVLPIIRLVMMAGHFARHAERHFTAITLAVLALILIGGAAGLVL